MMRFFDDYNEEKEDDDNDNDHDDNDSAVSFFSSGSGLFCIRYTTIISIVKELASDWILDKRSEIG